MRSSSWDDGTLAKYIAAELHFWTLPNVSKSFLPTFWTDSRCARLPDCQA